MKFLLPPGMNKEQLPAFTPLKKWLGLQSVMILLYQALDQVTVTSKFKMAKDLTWRPRGCLMNKFFSAVHVFTM